MSLPGKGLLRTLHLKSSQEVMMFINKKVEHGDKKGSITFITRGHSKENM